ncbi:DUF2989 domain-containing protein [Alteromonas sp. CYL-A6]|uniref:DUF2989 domain-containing protein n=1 Tax=Alteromonas nitratireducens TaxID=3390813 RepID=UPI0034B5EC7A
MTKLLKSFRNTEKTRYKATFLRNFSTLRCRICALLLLSLSLSGCDKLFEPTLAEICQDNPAMCNDLNQDGWCRSEKAVIIKMRYQHRDDSGEAYKYPMLLAFEDYLKCVDKASGIEHIKYRDKETTRLKGVLTAQREIKRLARETRQSDNPYLAHYHWSRYGDEAALKRFKDYVAANTVTEPQLLVFLAEEEVKNDVRKTVSILYDALALYSDADDINKEIFFSLVSIALELENYRMAYVWQQVTSYYDETAVSSPSTLLALQPDLPVGVLDAVADEIISALNSGEFDAYTLKLDRL